jgi:nucleotide-binding universal stress UspA family protein
VSAQLLHLREEVQDRRARYPEVDVDAVVRTGKPALALLEASTDIDMMLISRPFTHLRANALGTLSRALIREAVCTVEVVPAPARVAIPGGGQGPRHVDADAWGPI